MINIEVAEDMIRTMEDVVREQRPFDMSVWASHRECGTTACAAGWMMLDPRHLARGFHMDDRRLSGAEPYFNGCLGEAAIIAYLSAPGDIKDYSRIRSAVLNIFFADHYSPAARRHGVTAQEVLDRMRAEFAPLIEDARRQIAETNAREEAWISGWDAK